MAAFKGQKERGAATQATFPKWHHQDARAETTQCEMCSSLVVDRGVLDCCNHWFCFSCIDNWARVTNVCPLCKACFQFITCLPVGYNHDSNWNNPDGFPILSKREEGSNHEGNLPFSFPSYYIDEEAVVCLEGSACHVRAGLLSEDHESAFSAETSVACDLCDCWYHAGCVNFDPEKSTFYCPRCTISEHKRGNWSQTSKSGAPLSSEVNAFTLIGSLPAEELSYGGGTRMGSSSVAIAVAEKGESAVSISMRRIPDVNHGKPPPQIRPHDSEVMWSPIREPIKSSGNYGVIWSPIRDTMKVTQNYDLWSPTPESPTKDESHLEMKLPTPEPVKFVQNHVDCLPTQNEHGKKSKSHLESLTSIPKSDCDIAKSILSEQPIVSTLEQPTIQYKADSILQNGRDVPNPQIRSPRAVGQNISMSPVSSKGVDSSSEKTCLSAKVVDTLQLLKKSNDSTGSLIGDKDLLIDVQRLQVAVDHLRKGKQNMSKIDSKDVPEPCSKSSPKSNSKLAIAEGRSLDLTKELSDEAVLEDMNAVRSEKPPIMVSSSPSLRNDVPTEVSALGKRKFLQEDERKIDSKDLPEPPRKVSRKSSKKSDVLEEKSLACSKGSRSPIVLEDDLIKASDQCQTKTSGSGILNKDASIDLSVKEIEAKEVDTQIHDTSMEEDNDMPVVESTSPVDLRDIVRNPSDHLIRNKGEQACLQKGVRTRIIMHRETELKDAVGTTLVDSIRQQMRDSAGYVRGEEMGKVEVTDDRFIAAYKAALVRKNEKSKETKLSAFKQTKSTWLAKVMNSDGKRSRDSLTKKLYGGGTGRWDRDWDIAFWKERSAHMQRAQMEAKEVIEGLGNSKGLETDKPSEPDETDSFFSRLYVADTSLFARDNDVQPFSSIGKNLGEASKKPAVKGGLPSQHKGSALQRFDEKSPGKVVSSNLSTSKQSLDNLSGRRAKTKPVSGSPEVTRTATLPLKGDPVSDVVPKSSAKLQSTLPVASISATVGTAGTTGKSDDGKKDKRQWALEVLARKTGSSASSSGSAKTGGKVTKDGQFNLLLQLPIEMRPLLPHNRHSKVPTAVRQVQLNRIVEQELKWANVAIEQSLECEEVVNRAMAREEELFKKSNSKGVYVNLCVRSMAQNPSLVTAVDSTAESSDAVQMALEATGLLESPTSSPHSELGQSSKNEIPVSGTTVDKLKATCEHKWVENVLEMGNLDIYGDFDFSLDDEFDVGNVSAQCKGPAATSAKEADNKSKKMTVFLTTADCSSNSIREPAETNSKNVSTTPLLKETACNSSLSPALPSTENETPVSGVRVTDENDLYSGLDVEPIITETSHGNAALLESSVISPSKPQTNLIDVSCEAKPINTTSRIHDVDLGSLGNSEADASRSPIQPANNNVDDWMDTGKFSDLDRRIENIRRKSSPSMNKECDVPWNANVGANVDFTGMKDPNESPNIKKQVEIYVNQHLKPLYRSGVIKADQFRYAVTRTATKVMEHHAHASSADFLITEGSKVKKLADQYLQAWAKRKEKSMI